MSNKKIQKYHGLRRLKGMVSPEDDKSPDESDSTDDLKKCLKGPDAREISFSKDSTDDLEKDITGFVPRRKSFLKRRVQCAGEVNLNGIGRMSVKTSMDELLQVVESRKSDADYHEYHTRNAGRFTNRSVCRTEPPSKMKDTMRESIEEETEEEESRSVQERPKVTPGGEEQRVATPMTEGRPQSSRGRPSPQRGGSRMSPAGVSLGTGGRTSKNKKLLHSKVSPVTKKKRYVGTSTLAIQDKDQSVDEIEMMLERKTAAQTPNKRIRSDKKRLELVRALKQSVETGNNEMFEDNANSICQEFKKDLWSDSKYLLYNVWLGYNSDKPDDMKEKRICLVAEVNDKLCQYPLKDFYSIPIYWRKRNEVSQEGKETSCFEDLHINTQHRVQETDLESLFHNHSNLTMIHISSFKSSNFQTDDHILSKEPCIALYCRIKGIVPLGEKPFPRSISNMQTDVREGYCRLGAGELAHPGSPIACKTTNKSGTLGGFIELQNGKLGFITAAHVVLNTTHLDMGRDSIPTFWKHSTNTVSVGCIPNEIPGSVINHCFSHENSNSTSVDAAVVEIDRSLASTDGTFPKTENAKLRDTGYETNKLPRIINNTILCRDEIDVHQRSQVLKYGAKSALTIGSLKLNELHVRYETHSMKMVEVKPVAPPQKSNITIYKQMGVCSASPTSFFQMGDSGAFCCMIDKNDYMIARPFGMAIGVSTSGVCVVTPLEDVFNGLGLNNANVLSIVPGTQTSHSSSTASGADDKFDQIKGLLQNIQSDIKTTNRDVKTTNSKLNELKRNVNAKFKTVNKDITEIKSAKGQSNTKKKEK